MSSSTHPPLAMKPSPEPRVIRTAKGHLAWFRAPCPPTSRRVPQWRRLPPAGANKKRSVRGTRSRKPRVFRRLPPPSARHYSTRATSIRCTPQFLGIADIDQFGSHLRPQAKDIARTKVVDALDDLSWLNQFGTMRSTGVGDTCLHDLKISCLQDREEVEF